MWLQQHIANIQKQEENKLLKLFLVTGIYPRIQIVKIHVEKCKDLKLPQMMFWFMKIGILKKLLAMEMTLLSLGKVNIMLTISHLNSLITEICTLD